MRLGVLTGGGDCPGLNACIRAVVLRAEDYNDEVIGIKDGWKGLIEGDFCKLTKEDVLDIIQKGGTILGTSRKNPLKNQEDKSRLVENIKKQGFDCIIAIGGEDTLTVAKELYSKDGIRVVGVPKTMDNDLSETDYTFGFDTATTTAVDAIERLKDTGKSHKRVMVLEVMGRHAGWVALFAGLAAGADCILIPEIKVDLDKVAEHLKKIRESGREYATVVVSEGIEFEESQEKEAIAKDDFGHVLLKESFKDGKIQEVELSKATAKLKRVDENWFKLINILCK
jgi:6-phosphofructokinase 1